jgi:tRNA U55 pseudouridine synthase TruB
MPLPFEGKTHEVISVREETTDEKYGVYPEKRTIEQKIPYGFVLLDKAAGMRSKSAANVAKRLLSVLGVNKVGYSGTLE